jgi:hypothetical protein
LSAIRHIRRLASSSIAATTAAYVEAAWRRQRRQTTPHGLPGRLTVTLTSYPPRYPTLALTLKSLLAQSFQPDRFCLWIARSDLASLPQAVTELASEGLTIVPCDDLKSYKKIIPALARDDGDYLLTADDDVYYPRAWLREIVASYRAGCKEVICTRAHRIRLDRNGTPLPYAHWELGVAAGEASRLLFPTGIGGVLYEPRIFHTDVTNSDIFERLCPTTDDIWLYWMAALNGARFRKIGPRKRSINWMNSQHVALSATNNAVHRAANDEQIANMIGHYGFPGTLPPAPAEKQSRPNAGPSH